MMPDGTPPKPAKITQAKGKPWIHWVGKHGIEEIAHFPAQETERFDPHKEIERGGWSNLLFHGDNKEVMGHLLHEFRGKVDLVYIDPPFDSKADLLFPYTARFVRYLITETAEKAGVKKRVSAQILRDTCAVRQLKRGEGIEIVLQRLGLSETTWEDAMEKYLKLAEGGI